MQVTDALEELSQRDYTSKTVTGTKRPQTNFLKEESTNRQHGRVWGLTVTFVHNLPYCSVSPWLPLACHRHGDWAISAWLAQAADSLYVSVVSVTSSPSSAAKSLTENPYGLREALESVRKLMYECRPSTAFPLRQFHLLGRTPPAINEHAVPSVATIHKCADSHPWHSFSRSDVLPQPPALTNDLILQLVNIVPKLLPYLSADPAINASSCITRTVLNFLAVVYLHTHDVQYLVIIVPLLILRQKIKYIELVINFDSVQVIFREPLLQSKKLHLYEPNPPKFQLDALSPMLQKSLSERRPSAQCWSPASAESCLRPPVARRVMAWSSTCALQSAIVFCRTDHVLKTSPLQTSAPPLVDRLVNLSPTKSLSPKPSTLLDTAHHLNVCTILRDPIKYRPILFRVSQTAGVGSDMNWLTQLLANTRSVRTWAMSLILAVGARKESEVRVQEHASQHRRGSLFSHPLAWRSRLKMPSSVQQTLLLKIRTSLLNSPSGPTTVRLSSSSPFFRFPSPATQFLHHEPQQ